MEDRTITKLSENNKVLLKEVLEPIIDEIAFSERNKALIRHGGVAGEYTTYEKGLVLLKRMGVVQSFQNIRNDKPVTDRTVHAYDKFEVIFQEDTLLELAQALGFQNDYTSNLDNTHMQSPTPTVQKITLHPLQPKHYSDRKGVLMLNQATEITFAINGKTLRSNGKPYLQCKLLGLLFKNVKTIKSGIRFSTFYGVNDHYIDKKMVKRVRNTVSQINDKVTEVGGPNNLIYVQDGKIHLNHSYL